MKAQNVLKTPLVAAGVMTLGLMGAVAIPSASFAIQAEQPTEIIVDTQPTSDDVDFWCTEKNALGVKFDTGAVGLHTVAPISITIVDEDPTRVSSVTGTATAVPYKVIVNGSNGNAEYTDLANDKMIAPQISVSVENGRIAPDTQTKNSDIDHVIVCYRVVEDTSDDDVVVDDDVDTNDDTDNGDVLGANTDTDQNDDEGQVQGVETLAKAGVPAWVVGIVGVATMATVLRLSGLTAPIED